MEEFHKRYERLKEKLPIDIWQLDKELQIHAQLYEEAAELCANAMFHMTELKAEREKLESRISLDVRSSPEKFGLGKVTEASVSAKVTLEVGSSRIPVEYLEAASFYEQTKGLCTAFSHRKDNLKDLVSLYRTGYFADAASEQEFSAITGAPKKREIQR